MISTDVYTEQMDLRQQRLHRVEKALARVAAQQPPADDDAARLRRDELVGKLDQLEADLIAERDAFRQMRDAQAAAERSAARAAEELAGHQAGIEGTEPGPARVAKEATREARRQLLAEQTHAAAQAAEQARAEHQATAERVRREGAFTGAGFDKIIQACESAVDAHSRNEPRAASFPPPTLGSDQVAAAALAVVDAMPDSPFVGAAVGIMDYGPTARPRYVVAVSGDEPYTSSLTRLLETRLSSAGPPAAGAIAVLDGAPARSRRIRAVTHPVSGRRIWPSSDGCCAEAKLYKDRFARPGPPAGMSVVWYGGGAGAPNPYAKPEDQSGLPRMYACPCCELNAHQYVNGTPWTAS